ncbi:MAG: macro domain-containing protein [Alphaproteobacteria bacterium]|nr:macro domain-containing protein [Alphaproteobacteria bacterium]
MKLHLRDTNPALPEAWERAFGGDPAVTISQGDILDASLQADAIVSPANSFGFMDGGIDLAYSLYFGWGVQERLQARIMERHHGELPVGQATLVPTEHPRVPWLVSAPTMRVPMDVSQTVNAYLALRAALLAVDAANAEGAGIHTLLCPGLGAAVGRMPAQVAALQMRAAWEAWKQPVPIQRNPGRLRELHWRLIAGA